MKMGFKLQSWFRRRRSREEKITGMGLTVTEDTPADMLAGSMELLVQLPPDHHIHTQRVTVERSTAMMDLLVQIATAHKLAASSYTLQAIGERGLVLPHQSNTPIGALDALEVKLLPKQGTFIPRKTKQPSQPFETTFRLQVHLPRNQLYVSRVSPKTNLGDILDEVCREKNLDKNKYELRHPGNHKETLDLSLSLQDYHLQEVTLYAKQGQNLGSALSSQDIMALQRQEERRRQQAKQSVFGFIFKKSKESSLSTDSLGGRSVSPARSDETGRSVSPLTVPTRPQRKRRPAPNPPTSIHPTAISPKTNGNAVKDELKEKLVISHSRNSSDSSGYHEASVLSDNPDSAARMTETLPRCSKPPGKFETRKLAQTSQTSKSLCNLATNSGIGLTHAISNTSLSSTGIRKKRAAPRPPTNRPLSSAISTQALERIVDSEESLTSDMGVSKPPSDIAVSSETETNSKANSDISMSVHASSTLLTKNFIRTGIVETHHEEKILRTVKSDLPNELLQTSQAEKITSPPIEESKKIGIAKVAPRGKLVRSGSSIDNDRPSYSFVSQNRYEIIDEVNETDNSMKEKFASPYDSTNGMQEPKNISYARRMGGTLKPYNCPYSNTPDIPNQSGHGSTMPESIEQHNNVSTEEKLVEIPNLSNFKDITMSNVSAKKNHNVIDHTLQYQNRNSKNVNIVRDDKSRLLNNSHSFCCPDNRLRTFYNTKNNRTSLRLASKFDNSTMTNSSNQSISPLQDGQKKYSVSEHDITADNSSPPPLSTLQIFAISTKPVDIQAPKTNVNGNGVNVIPSFPLLNKYQYNIRNDKKLSIFEPPPPGLVSRQESNENWNQFLVQLNSILETRVAPVPIPRSSSRGPTVTPRRMLNASSSPSSAVVSTISDINDDSHQDIQDSKRNQFKVQVEIENKNDEIYIENKEESTTELQLKNDEAYDTVARNADDFHHSSTVDGSENPSLSKSDHSLPSNQPCTIIAAVPKCPLLLKQSSEIQMNNTLDNIGGKSLLEVTQNFIQSEISQSASDSSDFVMSTSEKSDDKKSSDEKNIVCTIDPNLPSKISHTGVDEIPKMVANIPREALVDNNFSFDEQYPPFIAHRTNLGLQMDLTHSTVKETLHSQRMGQSGVDGSRTVTDLLLQEVSTTLANVSPTSERLSQDVASNEVNIVEETDRVDSKTDVTQTDIETGSDSVQNSTVHSQQNTSDYVSATGEDLSATDWEYQLPDPPSAFRDNVAPDCEVYDTITPTSMNDCKEPIIPQPKPIENPTHGHTNTQEISENVIVAVPNSTLPKAITYSMNGKHDENHVTTPAVKEDAFTIGLSAGGPLKDSDENLRKDVICELSNKIENGTLNTSNGKNSGEDFRQSVIHKSAPEIAPVQNTLPNFKITTYPRQKSSNMYESSVPMSSYRTDRLQDRIINTFATLSRNTSAIPTKQESYLESRHRHNCSADDMEICDAPITRTKSVQHINSTSEKFSDSIREIIQVPTKEQDCVDNLDKNNIVHRSKSYIVLSHNSKYRGKKTHIPNTTDEQRMLKSTSVTNLNQESVNIDKEPLGKWNSNSRMFQNGKEEKELQSVQILKNILPQLKTNQQLNRDIPSHSESKHHIEEEKVISRSDDTDQVQLRNKTDLEIEQKIAEPKVTDKRWRYTGPPAISLGSWSERPCLNVKIKMDTDYKFGINNNNNNTNSTKNGNKTGAKTVVNLNTTSNDVDIVKYKDSFMKHEPKNDENLSSKDIKAPNLKRVVDDVGVGKETIRDTSVNQMESGTSNFSFAKLRTAQRQTRDIPVVINNAATKKSHLEEADSKENDIKIDTRPVNFKELTQTFGQVNLRVKPKYHSQNHHSDYFDARPNGNELTDNRMTKIRMNDNINESHCSSIKRYTSVIGIDAQLPSSLKKNHDENKKIHMTTTNINGPIPTVKGFKIHQPSETRVQSFSSPQKNSIAGSSKTHLHNPPPPPTMPIITGVTLKSHNAAPKSVSSCADPRDQLLESIRNFGRNKLRSVDTVF